MACQRADEQLTCERLRELLQEAGHPTARYGIERHGKYLDQTYTLERWSDRWVVYYIERGIKAELGKHVTEDAACRDLLARLQPGPLS